MLFTRSTPSDTGTWYCNYCRYSRETQRHTDITAIASRNYSRPRRRGGMQLPLQLLTALLIASSALAMTPTATCPKLALPSFSSVLEVADFCLG